MNKIPVSFNTDWFYFHIASEGKQFNLQPK